MGPWCDTVHWAARSQPHWQQAQLQLPDAAVLKAAAGPLQCLACTFCSRAQCTARWARLMSPCASLLGDAAGMCANPGCGFCHLAAVAAAAWEQQQCWRQSPSVIFGIALQQALSLPQQAWFMHVASTGLALFFLSRLAPDSLGLAISVAVAGPCSRVHEPKSFACSSSGKSFWSACAN